MKRIFPVILLFLFACTSERSFQVAGHRSLDPGTAQQRTSEEKENLTLAHTGLEDLDAASGAAAQTNSAPELTRVKFVPEVFRPGDTLGVEVFASDRDEDPVEVLYEWLVNGYSAGEDKSLEVPVKRGDKISVEIKPYDGKAYGRSVILEREVVNVPPVITESRKATFDGKMYMYQVVASDPDDDSLIYSLKTAPKNMTISKLTGLIKWEVPDDFTGLAKASVLVEDQNGGKAQYDLNITIKKEDNEEQKASL